jgi:hypothetical protein
MRAVPLLLRTLSGLRRSFRKLSPILRPAGAIDENPFFLRPEVLFAESATKVFSRAVWFLLFLTGHSIALALCRLPSLVCSTIATSSAPVAFSLVATAAENRLNLRHSARVYELLLAAAPHLSKNLPTHYPS